MKLDRDHAGIAIEAQLCANCWGQLTEKFIEADVRDVHCLTEGCPCTGFVSKKYIDRRLYEQLEEEFQARHALADLISEIVDAGKPQKTKADYLKMFGFGD